MPGIDEPRDVIALLRRADPTERDASPHEPDESQLAAARARVMQMLAAEEGGAQSGLPLPSRGSRRRRWTRVSAAILGMAVSASVVLLALPGRNNSAELSVMNATAKVAASRPLATTLRPGEYFHMLVRDFRNVTAAGLINDFNVESWVGSDGSGLVRQSIARSIYPGGSCSPAGPPPKGHLSATCAISGNMVVNDFRVGPGGLYKFQGDYIETWVRSLPSDGQELEAALQRHWIREYARLPFRVGRADSAQLLGLIGDALADPLTTPAVRSSLFRLAGTLPGLSVRTEVKDAYGRTGTQISTTGTTGVPVPPGYLHAAHGTQKYRSLYRLIFDPATSLILDADITGSVGGHQLKILLAFFDQKTVSSLPTSGDRSHR